MKTSKTVILTLCLLLVFTVFPAQAFADEGEVYKTLDLGTMYQNYDCFVYVPAETDENTACCVHFAGAGRPRGIPHPVNRLPARAVRRCALSDLAEGGGGGTAGRTNRPGRLRRVFPASPPDVWPPGAR